MKYNYISFVKLFVLSAVAELAAIEAISMEQAVESALRGNSALVADSLEIAVQSCNLRQARLPENPEIVFETENARFYGAEESAEALLSIDVEQSFSPVLRLKKTGVARAEAKKARVGYLIRKRDLVAEVKGKFIWAQTLQQELALADSLAGISAAVHRASVQQAISGKASYSDTLKTSAEHALSLLHRDRTGQELTNALQELSSTWGSAKTDYVCMATAIDSGYPLPDSSGFFSGLDESPRNSIAFSEFEIRNAELALEKASRIPSLRAGAGIGIAGASDKILPRASLSLTLPLLNRNRGAVGAGRFRVAQAESLRDAVRIGTFSDALNIYRSAGHLRNELQILGNGILPQFRENLEAALTSYFAGKTGILAVIDAQRGFYEIFLELTEIRRNYMLSIVELERIAQSDEDQIKP